jgi:hypothetical protein
VLLEAMDRPQTQSGVWWSTFAICGEVHLEPDLEGLDREFESMVDESDCVLRLDGSTLVKIDAKAVGPVDRHGSDKLVSLDPDPRRAATWGTGSRDLATRSETGGCFWSTRPVIGIAGGWRG